MYSKFFPKGGLPGILHHYTESLVAFESTPSVTARKPHSVLFIGGLGDGLGTTSYMADLATALQPTEWSIFTLNLTSSYQSWGLGHLDRDTSEIASCVRYIKDYKTHKFGSGKVVLMGHSTGSQQVLHYLHKPNPHTSHPDFDPWLEHVTRPSVDGAIMQAPVSDREAIKLVMQGGIRHYTPAECQEAYRKLEALCREAAKTPDGPYDTILPLSLTTKIGYFPDTPISARRFLSLASPDTPKQASEDDLFSSDLSDEQFAQTFGSISKQGLLKTKLMVLYSGADASVPEHVNKEHMLARFKKATNSSGPQIWDDAHSAVIPNASHALSNDDQAEPRRFLVGKVMGYLKTLDGAAQI